MANDRQFHRRAVMGGAGALALAAASEPAWAARGKPVAATGPLAQTKGGQLRGIDQGVVKVFKGVPYGASTAGVNRFMPPRPRQPWKGVRDAVAFGAISPQPNFPILAELDGSMDHAVQGEDCLMLNVWTPALDAKKRPVMVWFHGGGYAVGGGAAPWYDGSRLAERHDVVAVTVNHRLNAFGFLYLADLLGPAFADSGTVGMLDCVAALEWVRDNIAEFGGDPANVTIYGESGGAGKVSTLMGMPGAKGLFHRAIVESGAALKHMPPALATRSAKAVLDQLGVGAKDAAKLQAMPPETILAAMAAMKPPGPIGPVTDGRGIPTDPFDPAAPAVSAEVPMLIGSNLTEATFFPDTPLEPIDDATLLNRVKSYARIDEGASRELIALYRSQDPTRDNTLVYQLIASDYWMRAQVLQQAERKAAQGAAPVYVYQFNWMSPGHDGKLHCPHGSEIPFAMDNVDKAVVLLGDGPTRQPLADMMSAAWTAFARTGRPDTPALPHWPAYDTTQRAVMVFDNRSAVELDPNGAQRAAIAAIKAKQG